MNAPAAIDTPVAAARDPRPLARARWIALLLPAVLLAGAWVSQLWGGLVPCHLCHWQRWPHYAALGIALASFVVPGLYFRRGLVALAGVGIALSGAIGVYHAGVEWHWWAGPACSSSVGHAGMSADELLRALMAAPIVPCDVAQWRLLGISLAGWNALFSLAGAGAIGWLLARGRAA